MHPKMRGAGWTLMGLASLAILAGCGSGGSQTASSSFNGTVTIGYENAPDPESVAIAKKYFQKELKLPVRMEYFQSGPSALTALASGKLDFMTTLGNPPTAAAIARGVPLTVIWAMERYTTGEGLVVKRSSGIHSLKQLEGKTVALVKGSTSPFELETALKLHHLSVNGVTELNMSPTEMVSAWKTNQIQAAYVWVPFDTEMAQDGGTMLMYDQNVYQEAPIFNLAVVNSNWAKAHPTQVEDFVRAEADGVKFFQQNPAQAYQAMAQVNGISAAAAKAQTEGFSFSTLSSQVTPNWLGSGSGVAHSLVTKSLTSAANWLKASGQISTVPSNMAQYVDPSYAAAVLRSAKK
ncbi:ABC transporter substrate-binding protein [Sulfobacillus harzensis]|uniref:ABC transporter substrate-binding protein n=1 Tax=Sulfobacillus harzensis TaxID=2729629 RepID=A0A7Y0Q1H7_9FIRM|nr:ABC transporter substrate-binding protein [Sulfobacillus harzensis]NMP21335.1 ABC transporter substrate-binding protein [Sulfobacillus harzensis]